MNNPSWNDLPKELQQKAEPIRRAVRKKKSVLIVGPPGSGKTMVARRLALDLVNKDNEQNLIEASRIHRMAGIESKQMFVGAPFRAPHHTCSTVAMIGRPRQLMPGELSLAHGGVLFLDEVADFRKEVLEAVRLAWMDKQVVYPHVSRQSFLRCLPTDFALVGATNPCPCGFHGTKKCACSEDAIERYRKRVDVVPWDVTVEIEGRKT